MKEINGYQIGEYFGSCVCVVDFNSDGLDDLVVGAPLHSLKDSHSSQNKGDEGRIYVFINKGNMGMDEIGTKIMGSQRQGARFGTAISCLGDLNNDDFPDIAVGAPYENSGHGTIYIYHGQSNGIYPTPVQQIKAQDIDRRIFGFGFSISKGSDIDGNKYHDVAVGAYDSGHAVILKSHPVITFDASLIPNITIINLNTTGFMVTACITYKGEYVPESLVANVTLELDPKYQRAEFLIGGKGTTLQYEVVLNPIVKKCSEYEVQVTDKNNDFSKPVELIIGYELPESRGTQNNKREFCKSCPVVDPSAPNQTKFVLHYATGCTKNDVCYTDLKTEAELKGVKLPLDIGSIDILKIDVIIKSLGDPAFLSYTNISFPSVTPLIRVPSNCKEMSFTKRSSNDSGLRCEMGNPLLVNDTRRLMLEFDARNIPSGTDRIIYKISSVSSGEEVKEDDNDQEIDVPLRTISDLSIVGKSMPERIHLVKKNDSYMNEMISLYHIYEVRNFGPSPVEKVILTFSIPVMIQSPSGSEVHFMESYEQQVSFNYDYFSCNPKGFQFDSVDGIYQGDTKDTGSNSKREDDDSAKDINLINHASSFAHHGYRTFFVSCSEPGVKCRILDCTVGPFKSAQSIAHVYLTMKIRPEVWKPLTESKDTIIVSTFGSVKILDSSKTVQPENPKPDFAEVNTFIEKLRTSNIAAWVVVLAIIGGILFLLILILGLKKLGFFKRHKKEELKCLKNAVEMQEHLSENETED